MTSRKTRQLYDHSLNQTVNQNSNMSHSIKNSHINANEILNHLNLSNSSKTGKGNDSLSNNIPLRRNEFGFSHSYNHSHKNIREIKADSLSHKPLGKYNNLSTSNNTNNTNGNNVDLQNLFSTSQSYRTSANGNSLKNNVNININNENTSFRTPIPKNPKWKTSISNFINASANNNTNNNASVESKVVSQVQGLSNSKRAQLLSIFKKQIFFFAVKTSDPKITRLHKKIISLGAVSFFIYNIEYLFIYFFL